MADRILTAQFTVTGSASDENLTATIDQTKLNNAIDGLIFIPFAMVFSENSNVTLKKVSLKSDKNDERLVILMPSAANGVGLKELNSMWNPEAGGIPRIVLKVKHGCKLEVTADNASGSNQTITVVFYVHNAARTDPVALSKVLELVNDGSIPDHLADGLLDRSVFVSKFNPGQGKANPQFLLPGAAANNADVFQEIGKSEKAGEFILPSGKGA